MADSKITALAALTTADPANDMFPVVDVSDTSMAASGTTKRISINNILACSPSATLASATITGAATVGTTLGVTGVSTFAAGTALLPALTTTGDTNTGIYYPAADTFAVTTGGTERYRVDSAGNCGIGVTPSAWGSQYRALQIFNNSALYGASAYGYYGLLFNGYNDNTDIKAIASLYVGEYRYELTAGAHKWFGTTANATAGATATPVQSMTLDASGNLLTGTTSTGGSASNATKTVGGSFSTVNGVSASTATAVAVTLFTVPTEAVFIVSAFVPAYAAPTQYNAVSIVKVNGGVATTTALSTGANISIAMSGLNVQATQLTGGASTISYSAIRIS